MHLTRPLRHALPVAWQCFFGYFDRAPGIVQQAIMLQATSIVLKTLKPL